MKLGNFTLVWVPTVTYHVPQVTDRMKFNLFTIPMLQLLAMLLLWKHRTNLQSPTFVLLTIV